MSADDEKHDNLLETIKTDVDVAADADVDTDDERRSVANRTTTRSSQKSSSASSTSNRRRRAHSVGKQQSKSVTVTAAAAATDDNDQSFIAESGEKHTSSVYSDADAKNHVHDQHGETKLRNDNETSTSAELARPGTAINNVADPNINSVSPPAALVRPLPSTKLTNKNISVTAAAAASDKTNLSSPTEKIKIIHGYVNALSPTHSNFLSVATTQQQQAINIPVINQNHFCSSYHNQPNSLLLTLPSSDQQNTETQIVPSTNQNQVSGVSSSSLFFCSPSKFRQHSANFVLPSSCDHLAPQYYHQNFNTCHNHHHHRHSASSTGCSSHWPPINFDRHCRVHDDHPYFSCAIHGNNHYHSSPCRHCHRTHQCDPKNSGHSGIRNREELDFTDSIDNNISTLAKRSDNLVSRSSRLLNFVSNRIRRGRIRSNNAEARPEPKSTGVKHKLPTMTTNSLADKPFTVPITIVSEHTDATAESKIDHIDTNQNHAALSSWSVKAGGSFVQRHFEHNYIRQHYQQNELPPVCGVATFSQQNLTSQTTSPHHHHNSSKHHHHHYQHHLPHQNRTNSTVSAICSTSMPHLNDDSIGDHCPNCSLHCQRPSVCSTSGQCPTPYNSCCRSPVCGSYWNDQHRCSCFSGGRRTQSNWVLPATTSIPVRVTSTSTSIDTALTPLDEEDRVNWPTRPFINHIARQCTIALRRSATSVLDEINVAQENNVSITQNAHNNSSVGHFYPGSSRMRAISAGDARAAAAGAAMRSGSVAHTTRTASTTFSSRVSSLSFLLPRAFSRSSTMSGALSESSSYVSASSAARSRRATTTRLPSDGTLTSTVDSQGSNLRQQSRSTSLNTLKYYCCCYFCRQQHQKNLLVNERRGGSKSGRRTKKGNIGRSASIGSGAVTVRKSRKSRRSWKRRLRRSKCARYVCNSSVGTLKTTCAAFCAAALLALELTIALEERFNHTMLPLLIFLVAAWLGVISSIGLTILQLVVGEKMPYVLDALVSLSVSIVLIVSSTSVAIFRIQDDRCFGTGFASVCSGLSVASAFGFFGMCSLLANSVNAILSRPTPD